MKIKKALFTLNIGDYAPELRCMTYPLLKAYAYKIGAEFFEITERVWPDKPPVYEKFQIYKLAKDFGADWNIYLDADALVRPDFPDVTTLVPKDTVLFHLKDFVTQRFRADEYFLRDGRHIGEGNWFTIASDWCLDLWHPLEDISYEEAVSNIFPTPNESNTVIKPEHLIDDYVVSRNIARFGLKHKLLSEELARYGRNTSEMLWHAYTIPIEQKEVTMKQVLEAWRIKV